jgi:hypothetical protein
MDTIEETIIGICPSCGKPMKIEAKGSKEEGEISVHCENLCSNPAAIPRGARIMKDDIGLIFTDGDMHEYTREDYIKNHGIDPLPVWRAIEKERGLTTEPRR